MTSFRVLLFYVLLTIAVFNPSHAQEDVEDFIISVVSNYKNPMAYYPLRQDIFLPDELELAQIERINDRPLGALTKGSFIFIKNDTLDRERFISSEGSLLYPSLKYRGLSKRAGYTYRLRRHQLLMRGNENLGKFLWYNQQYKKLD